MTYHVEVDQKSVEGRIGIEILAEADFVGPPCDLSDLKVEFFRERSIPGSNINVRLYDLETFIGANHRYHPTLEKLFS